ncbi:MAG: hypothetical protein WC877_00085 [Dehalococcoidales bacterium]|jgi:hypothetical protein
MPQTIQVREGDFGPFQYQISEYDESTDALLPVDLTDETITFYLHHQVQQTDGSFKSVEVATGDCIIIDESEGWIQYDIAEGDFGTHGMYVVSLKRTNSTLNRTYPRYDEQWVRVIPLTKPDMEFTP